MTNKKYDMIAIGAGSAGLSIVESAAKYGAKCAVIESARIGGTCVNVGCVPKKVMWYAADIAHTIKDSMAYGFTVKPPVFSWSHLIQQREQYIKNINDWYHTYLADSNIDLITGNATFVAPHCIEVNGMTYEAPHIAITTGGYPDRLDIPGAELGITSDGFFALREQPKRVIIVGAGYIAVELAGVLNALGSEVTLVLRGEKILRGFDDMLREALMDEMLQDGINIMASSHLTKIEKTDRNLTVYCNQQTQHRVDCLIWAVGRKPNTAHLNLDNINLERDQHGFIRTDLKQNTNIPGLYAIGDNTGRAALTPVAIAAARRLGDRLFNQQPERFLDYELIPSAVYSHPCIATIGLTEEAARLKHGQAVKIYQTRFTSMYYAFTQHPRKTAMKLVTVGAQEKIVGCHIIGPAADEMLQGFAVAIKMGATKQDFDNTLAIHPTSAEELVTMKG